jgi:hypothetical protein
LWVVAHKPGVIRLCGFSFNQETTMNFKKNKASALLAVAFAATVSVASAQTLRMG